MSRLIAAAGGTPASRASSAQSGSADKGYLDFKPIDSDPGAKAAGRAPYDGKFHLLKDERGHPHAGYWTGTRWARSDAETIVDKVVDYCARRPIDGEPVRG